VKAGDAYRLWLPCAEPDEAATDAGEDEGGCAIARGSGGADGKRGGGALAVLLALGVVLKIRRARAGAVPSSADRVAKVHARP